MRTIEAARIQRLNQREPAARDYILYWMQQAQRATFNPALEHAVRTAGLGGRNSPFTAALLASLDDPGLKLEDVFKRVIANVRERTQGFQEPWTHSSITGDFYFHPPSSDALPTEVAAQPAALADRPDYFAWMAIQGSREPVDYQTFIEAFPNSPLLPFAKNRLRSLGAE